MTTSLELELTPRRIAMLLCFALATVLLIPAHQFLLGAILAAASGTLIFTDPHPKVRRRLGILLGTVVILAACDIHPALDDRNFIALGIPFALVTAVPFVSQRWGDSGVIRYRFWPVHWRRDDLIYTILSVPLAWLVLRGYEWGNLALFDDELFRHWTLPPEPNEGMIRRLFIGINLVGIWDELFFVNTVFALLRSLFRFPVANALQAVLYTAVLYDMAFTGLGAIVVFAFALTQGSMFEKSESLLWVLLVHLIVDYFLVAFIVQTYYPDYGLDFLWRKGF
jgi:hypothetical protein